MAIHELTDEQTHTMSLKEKDTWWLTKVFKHNEPQLTVRSALTGIILGGILSLTNLYVGIKTGWTLGVGISSVILSFAFFKILSKLKIGSEMGVLENNAMQSIATSAGYMTSPLMASIPAYMMVTGKVIPMWECFWWIVILAILGVLYAFPLKKKYINDEQLPFPEGRASGIVLDSLHSDDGQQGSFKAKVLTFGALLSAGIEVIRSETAMKMLKVPFLKIPETWDSLVYNYYVPAIWGTPLKNLTIQFDTSIVMFGTGGLMNIKTGSSLLLGGFINYFILAPYLIKEGIIPQATFKSITMWSLWGGVAMMTTASLYSFFSNPEVLLSPIKKFLNKSESKEKDPLEHIELPLWISFVGIPIFGAIAVYFGHVWFDIHYTLGIIAIPLVFVFTLIAVNSTGQTGITPGGALGKLTQITYSVLAPGNVPTNLMTAGITSEVSLNASNLLMDIKPGYMLGGKPRHQAIGHVLGIFAGSLIAVPVFYQIFHGDISLFTTDKLPLPGASIWKAVAEVLTKGLSTLHPTTQIAVAIGAVLGIIIEIVNKKMKGRFPISVVGLGLGCILRFSDSLSMGLGSVVFWYAGKAIKNKEAISYRALVDNQETLSAGIIAGGSIIGIILILLETMG